MAHVQNLDWVIYRSKEAYQAELWPPLVADVLLEALGKLGHRTGLLPDSMVREYCEATVQVSAPSILQNTCTKPAISAYFTARLDCSSTGLDLGMRRFAWTFCLIC